VSGFLLDARGDGFAPFQCAGFGVELRVAGRGNPQAESLEVVAAEPLAAMNLQ
jgi:hypothetical protein